MTSQRPHAVLWDMDGTIVDTEPLWMAAEEELFSSRGLTWNHEQAKDLIGSGLYDAAAYLQRAGIELSADEIVDTLTERVMSQIEAEAPPFRPGAFELLQELRKSGVKIALVTMSFRRMALAVAESLPSGTFDLVVAGDDVERPKPAPDAYLRAAELLGVDIADCVAIEDSPTGLTAAVASGATAIGVPNLLPLDGIGAHALWESLAGRSPLDIFELHTESVTTS